MSPPRRTTRRRLLCGLGGSVAVALAGCRETVERTDPAETTAVRRSTTRREGTTDRGTSADRKSAHRESILSETPTPTITERDAATAAPIGTATATPTATPVHADYETTVVRAVDPAGETLGAVTVAIADTGELRYLGLSDTDSLPADRGMLFVFESADDRTFVMREMDFGIDTVYADADGEITEIHHAPAPEPDEDGEDQRYPGYGRYVLEVNYEWTSEHGVTEGDSLEFEL